MLMSAGQLLAVVLVVIVIVIAFYLWMKDVAMFMDTATDLTGKTCIVTGANAGMLIRKPVEVWTWRQEQEG